MRCPSCDNVNAYIGFSSIECVNQNCSHFSQSWLSEVCRSKSPDTLGVAGLGVSVPRALPQSSPPSGKLLVCYFRKFDTVENTILRLRSSSRYGKHNQYANELAKIFSLVDTIAFYSRDRIDGDEWQDTWGSKSSPRYFPPTFQYINLTKLGYIHV